MQELSQEYLMLFNTLTDTEVTLMQLRAKLIAAQQQTEELYMQRDETYPYSKVC